MSSKYNDTPEKSSRTYDKDRDGFVIAGGAGIVVLEEYEHAIKRGANIYAELVGYGATSDGHDMVAPSGEGAERSMKIALGNNTKNVDYINTHGTSTPVGDVVEVQAIHNVFGGGDYGHMPLIASTKSLSGHALGAAGVNEAIYSLIMMKNNFIAASANVENVDENLAEVPIVTEALKDKELKVIMSNSFGFGGTNATLVFKKL
jgi:3-oxoacyl-[acyl-carrier-protein] synthase-1